jgi:HK97 family phage portal protein
VSITSRARTNVLTSQSLDTVLQQRMYLPSGAGDPWAIPSNGSLASYTASGVPVTEDTAMQLIAVAACVRILSTAVAGLPLDSVQMNGKIRKQLDPAPLIVADPFGGANNQSWPTRRTGFGQMMVSLLLRGNAYGIVTARDKLMYPTRIRVLHPDRVAVGLNSDGSRKYEVSRLPVDTCDMVHILGMSMPESPIGMSVISYARNAIGLGLAAEEFGARFFGSGAHLSGVIEVPGDLDKDKARALKEGFEGGHSGLSKAHMVGVLSGGAKWAPISVSPEDAQFLGTRAAQNLDVAMLFGVPPHMLGQVDRTTSWGTGIEQQSIGFLKYTLSDWIGLFEETWGPMLPKPQVAKFNVAGLLRTDTAGRYAAYTQARNGGWLTIDEIRALEDNEPLPNGAGENPFTPLNSSSGAPAGGPPAAEPDPGASSPTSDAITGQEP